VLSEGWAEPLDLGAGSRQIGMNMNFLVTGGAGFIGSKLVRRLLQAGHELTILDNLSTGNRSNLIDLMVMGKVEIVNQFLLDVSTVSELVKNTDRVFHLAAAVGVFNIVNDPLGSFKTNIDGTHSILEACRQYGKPLTFTSSSEIYGKNSNDALSENDDRIIGSPQVSRWSYSESKAVDEFLISEYHRKYGLETRIVRLFNTVGPGQVGHYGMVIPRFVKQALSGEPISIYGDGKQTRCFTHVDDVVEALLLVDASSNAIGKVYNIGNNFEISMIDLANRIIQLSDSKSTISFVDYKDAYSDNFEDMRRRVPNTSKIEGEIGWKAKKTLDEIIVDVVNHEKKVLA